MEIGKVCVASWGSYNACNESEATLGVWIDFNDFEELSEIEEYLKNNHNFKIDGIDEELFIIDDDNGLYPYDADILKALADNIRNMDLNELEQINDNYSFYSNYSFYDYAVEIFEECYKNQIPNNLIYYIDLDAFARDLSYDYDYIESSDGLLIKCA